MNHIKQTCFPLAMALATTWFCVGKLPAQTTVIPTTYAIPSSAADTNQPGFIWNISEVALPSPPNISWAESQLAGLQGVNLADTNAEGIASGPALAANPPTAPISFVIPGVINLSRAEGSFKGNFTPDDQMPGLPGAGPNGSDNAAAEALTYLDLPVGTNTIGVNCDDGFRMTLGGAHPLDKFAANVGQSDGSGGAHDTIFQVVISKAGLYAVRMMWYNGGGDANVELFTVTNGTDVLVNDLLNGGIPAYAAVNVGAYAYARAVDPPPSGTDVSPGEGIHIALVDGSAPIAQNSILLTLDGVPVSPVFSRSGNTTLVDYDPGTPWLPRSTHTASFAFTDGTLRPTNTWSFVVQNYISLDAAWLVNTVDTNKPGFIWNIFANSDPGNKVNTNERAEKDVSLQAVDATGVLLPNNADPAAIGAAIGKAAAPSDPTAPVHFEIATSINLDIAQTNMPGAPSVDGSTDGQAAEVLTYLTLPVGVVNMQIDSDDGFRLYSGAQPADVFGRAVVAEHNGATGPVKFSFVVPQAGTYPFRLVWENGSGGSHLIWSSNPTYSTNVLVNDVAHGGIQAYRSLVAGTTPRVVGTTPVPAVHQMRVTDTNLTVVLADGSNPIDDNSVTLTIDGNSVTPVKQRLGTYLSVSDNGAGFPGLQLPSDVHSATLTYKDSTGLYSRTQQFSFNNIQILILPTNPIVQENFDSYPEATSSATTVPPGWTAWNYTLVNTPGWNLADKSSDSYKDWIIISSTTMGMIEGGTASYDVNQTVNGQPVDPTNFFSGNVLWATSDGRSGVQAQFCTSAPFNLSSVTNPVMIYSSIMRMSAEANVQADGIEYSIDGGKTWFPGVIYFTIAHTKPEYVKLLPNGDVDVPTMLNTSWSVLNWIDPVTGKTAGGTFGSGLAEPVTQALAPYVAPRSDGQAIDARVDGIRLPMASKQKDVRLRFYQLGNCSWWWGVDNLAFYDIGPTTLSSTPAAPHIDTIQAVGGSITVKWSNGGTLQTSPSLSNPSWTSTGNSSGTFTEPLTAGAKFYRVSR
jgi:hypothetical protein